MPGLSGRCVLSTRTGMFLAIAGARLAGCRTLPPWEASSAASSKDMRANRPGAGDDAGVGREHAVDVGPDLDLLRVDRVADERGREVAAVAADRADVAGLVLGDEAGHDRDAGDLLPVPP